MIKSKNRKLAVSSIVFLLTAGATQASTFQIDFTTAGVFSGTAPSLPSSTTFFATAIFDDHGGTGSATLTMSVLSNLSAGAYVNDWYFNVTSAPLSSITHLSGVNITSPSTPPGTIENGVDAFKADGTGGKFDFAFHFDTSNPGMLGQGFSSAWTLDGSGITASSFNSLSVPDPNGGNYLSATHVQGYGGSAWIAGTQHMHGDPTDPGTGSVPEPATLFLIGLGLLGVAASRRQQDRI